MQKKALQIRGTKKSPALFHVLADAVLFLLVFFGYLAIAGEKCGGSFCAADSYLYNYIAKSGDFFVAAMQFPIGATVLLPMRALNFFMGSVLAVRIVAAFYSAIFALLLSYVAERLYGKFIISKLFAVFFVSSFWYLRISIDLYKNVASLAGFAALVLILLELERKITAKWVIAAFAAIFFIFLSHASSSFFLVVAGLIFLGIYFFERKELALAAVFMLAAIAISAISSFYLSNLPWSEKQLAGSMAESVFYRGTIMEILPLSLLGVFALWKAKPKIAAGLLSLILATLLLCQPELIHPTYAWRFALDGSWAFLLSAFGAMLFASDQIGLIEKNSDFVKLAFFSIVLFYCFAELASIYYMGLGVLSNSHELYTSEDFASVRSFIAENTPKRIYIEDIPWGLNYFMYSSGFGVKNIITGACPQNAQDGSWHAAISLDDENQKEKSDLRYGRMLFKRCPA